MFKKAIIEFSFRYFLPVSGFPGLRRLASEKVVCCTRLVCVRGTVEANPLMHTHINAHWEQRVGKKYHQN